MNEKEQVNPAKIMQISSGAWSNGILGAAVAHSVFTHIENGVTNAQELSEEAEITLRGAQCLLDGLLGIGCLVLTDGQYANGPDSALFLVKGKPAYLGDYVLSQHNIIAQWQDLPQAVKGEKTNNLIEMHHDNSFWESLDQGLAAFSMPAARGAAEELGIAKAGPISILDIGGGLGVHSAVCLEMNPEAKATQIEWANVNRLAREFVDKFNVGDRFTTVDSDFREANLGSEKYDYVICSNICHAFSPEVNAALFRKVRHALKQDGTLLISDFILNDDRTGHPFVLLFSANMVLETEGGAAWRRADYQAWLKDAGFKDFVFKAIPETPTTFLIAK